jgi:hypothetical protein
MNMPKQLSYVNRKVDPALFSGPRWVCDGRSWDQEVTIHGGRPVRPSGYERDLKTHHGPPAWSLHNGFLIAKLEPDFLAFENPLRKYEEVFRAERS